MGTALMARRNRLILSILVDTFHSSFRSMWAGTDIQLPSLAAFVHAYIVFSGIPNSAAAFAPPSSFANFTAWILYSDIVNIG